MTDSAKAILVSIDDAVLRLDVESALTGAGYRIVHSAAAAPLPDDMLSAALIDADPPSDVTLPLVRALRGRGVVCLVFTGGEEDGGAMPDGIERLSKPLVSDYVLSRVAGATTGRPARAEASWTASAPAAKSASG